jgi:hypothetical protein
MLQKFDFLWSTLEKNMENTSSNFEGLSNDMTAFRTVFNELVHTHLPEQWSQLHKYVCAVDNKQVEYEQKYGLVLAKVQECSKYCESIGEQIKVAHDNMKHLNSQVQSIKEKKFPPEKVSSDSISQMENVQKQLQDLVHGYAAELNFVKDLCQQNISKNVDAKVQQLEGVLLSTNKGFQKLEEQYFALSQNILEKKRLDRIEDDMRELSNHLQYFSTVEERVKELEYKIYLLEQPRQVYAQHTIERTVGAPKIITVQLVQPIILSHKFRK